MRELKRMRNERGWSQQRLADESGVNKATINQVEQGKRSPTIETLEKLAEALGVEVADFFPKAQAQLPLPELDAVAGPGERELDELLSEIVAEQRKFHRERRSIKFARAKTDSEVREAAVVFKDWWLMTFLWLTRLRSIFPSIPGESLREISDDIAQEVRDILPAHSDDSGEDLTEELRREGLPEEMTDFSWGTQEVEQKAIKNDV